MYLPVCAAKTPETAGYLTWEVFWPISQNVWLCLKTS
jgi:hypothetical protein